MAGVIVIVKIGAIIEKGPQNWQIIQQKGNCADVHIAGKYVKMEKSSDNTVFARIVHEDTSEIVIPWTKCHSLSDDRWEITFVKIPSGGLYRIETCLNPDGNFTSITRAFRGDMIHHIGVGDIYVIAGQSNSSGYGRDPVFDPPEIGVHLLRNNGNWDLASHPLNDSTNTIHEVTNEGINPAHAPWLIFAKMLKKNLGYPIGLIQTALGGSPLREWNPQEDGTLYDNMLEILKSQFYSVKGVLWYQGCTDAIEGLGDSYLDRFRCFVESLRNDLNDCSLPFFTAQLNRCTSIVTEDADNCWGAVREAQRQAAERISNVYVVPTIDCSLSNSIHNSATSNMTIGERFARLALRILYGRNYFCLAPDLKYAKKTDLQTIELYFDNIYESIYAFNLKPEELPFSVMDEAGINKIEAYQIVDRNRFKFTLERVLKGNGTVSGAFGQNPQNVTFIDTASNLPMLSFFRVNIT